MAFSFSVLADFISAMAASGNLKTTIHNLSDLQGKPVGATQGTLAAKFLSSRSVKLVEYPSFAATTKGLKDGEVVAIVDQYPAVRYFANYNPGFVLAGDRLNEVEFGIVVAEGNNPLREAINRALLKLQEQDVLKKLNNEWFNDKP
jgi:ABC-type amino acid transport substrate-binding protein